MVREPVQQGTGQPFAAQDLRPFVERQVAGDQRGAALVALARSSFMMIRSLAVTSNAGARRALQMPPPNPPVRHPERLVFAVADPVPQRIPGQVFCPHHLAEAGQARCETA